MALTMLSFSGNVSAYGTLSTSDILLPYSDFTTGDVTFDGKADETGLFKFDITFTNDYTIHVAFRHNGENIHAVLTTNNAGWLALGWDNKTPASTTGAGPMVDANIVIGGNNMSRDDTGSYATHSADATNNNIKSYSTVTSSGASFEFLFPLASSDAVDQPLAVENWGYFIVATGISADVDNGHSGGEQAMYIKDVYIESSAKEGYKKKSGGSAPFADPAIIALSLGLVAVLATIKRKK